MFCRVASQEKSGLGEMKIVKKIGTMATDAFSSPTYAYIDGAEFWLINAWLARKGAGMIGGGDLNKTLEGNREKQ